MKRACYVFWIFCITLSFRTSMTYGQAPQLELHLDREKIQVEETFVVTLIGKDLEQVVGIDGELLYDQEKLLLLSKEILLPEDQMIDLQAHYDGFEDSTGRGRLLFGLKGHIPPWVEAEKPLARFIFKGQLPGEGRLWIGERSRLVKETEDSILWSVPDFREEPFWIQIYGWGSFTGEIHLDEGGEVTGTKVLCYQGENLLEEKNLKSSEIFSLNQLPDGTYRIRVEKTGYQPEEHSFTISEGNHLTYPFQLVKLQEDAAAEEPNDVPGEELNDELENESKEGPATQKPKDDPPPREPEENEGEKDQDEGNVIPSVPTDPTKDRSKKDKEIQQNTAIEVGSLTLKVDGLPISVDKLQVLVLDIHNENQRALQLRSPVYQISLTPASENLWIPFKIQLIEGIENLEAVGIYTYLVDKQKWVYTGGEKLLSGSRLEGFMEPNRIFAVMENKDFPSFPDVERGELGEVIRKFTMGGIVVGFEDGTFRPDQPITLEAFLAMLLRLYDVPLLQDDGESEQNMYAAWAKDVCYTAKHIGLLQEGAVGPLYREMSLSMKELLSLFSSMKAIMAESVQDVPTKRIHMKEIEKDRIPTRAEVVLWLNEVVE